MSNVLQSFKKQSSRVLSSAFGNNNNNNEEEGYNHHHTNDHNDTTSNDLELRPQRMMKLNRNDSNGNNNNNNENTNNAQQPRSSFQRLFGGSTSQQQQQQQQQQNEEGIDDSQQQILMNDDDYDDDDDNNNNNSNPNENSWTEEISQYCPKLTFQERIIGFACSFGLGYLIAFFSFRFFIKLIEGNPIPFAINYTTGHVLQLLSSMFLCGPQRQFRVMFDQTRYMTSVIYLSCLVLTMILIFIPMPSLLKLLLLLCFTCAQFCASCWYSLSYIPYGRRTALRIIKKYTIHMILDQEDDRTTTTNNNESSFITGRFSLNRTGGSNGSNNSGGIGGYWS